MSSTPGRYRMLLVIAGAFFLLLWLRLIDLQIVKHRYYADIALENRIQLAVDIARRGLIRDRNGDILALNSPSYSVYLLRGKAVPLDSVVDRLALVLDLDSAQIMQRVRTSRLPHFEPVRVARHVPLETICRIEEQNELLPGILLRYETTRNYPSAAGGSHMLGYLTEATGSASEPAAPAGSFVGVRGVERQFNAYLRGIDGVVYLDVTAAGQVVGVSRDPAPTPAIPGTDVQLTVDWELQAFCAQALAARGSGSVICVDPRTGGILAMVNSPAFDGNVFSGVLRPEVWDALVNDSLHPLLDRSLRGLYPPGSTTKLITAGAALDAGIVAVSTRFSPCFGGMQFGNRFFRCWKESGHGSLDMIGAIEQSCDVYFYQLSQRLGVERWADYARQCGFGVKTGVDLPDEASGLVPDSAYYNRRYGKRGWTWTLILNLGIGQGEFLVTPLQLAQFYAAVANDGVAMELHVLKALRIRGADPILNTPEVDFELPCKPATLRALRTAIRQVVAGTDGSARRLNYPDLAIAGKTGTAQNPHGENHSWFACYAPFDKPEIVVAALAENAGQGSEIAAPLCGDVLRFYFGLPPLEPEEPDLLAPALLDTVQTDTVSRGI